jgi:MraZ protein
VARRFRGESTHRVDQKGRVSIPAPFRRVLEEGDPDWAPGAQPQLIIAHGQRVRNCLDAYSVRGMERLEEEIAELPHGEERDTIERLLFTKSVYAAVDDTGRIVLPQKLREQIGLGEEALFAGLGERFEIWEPGAYAEHEGRSDRGDVDPLRLLAEARRRHGLAPGARGAGAGAE